MACGERAVLRPRVMSGFCFPLSRADRLILLPTCVLHPVLRPVWGHDPSVLMSQSAAVPLGPGQGPLHLQLSLSPPHSEFSQNIPLS